MPYNRREVLERRIASVRQLVADHSAFVAQYSSSERHATPVAHAAGAIPLAEAIIDSAQAGLDAGDEAALRAAVNAGPALTRALDEYVDAHPYADPFRQRMAAGW